MLNIERIYASYEEFEALHGISLEIARGEIVALLGSNGSGKTTTINAVSGILKINKGDILFQGTSIRDVPPHQRVEMGIVQVPEGRKLFPSMSVYENLLIGSYLPESRKERQKNLEMCYSVFPKLQERGSQLAGSLSGGEQQMCAIARALMSRPKLLMLDEPSLGLAPVVVDTIFDVLLEINKMGVTIMLVEQNVLRALDIAQRGYVIETGQNVLDGTGDKLRDNDEIRKAYLGI